MGSLSAKSVKQLTDEGAHPVINLSREELRKLLLGMPTHALLRRVVHHLSTPPYFLEISGLIGTPYDGRHSEIIQLLTALRNKSLPTKAGSQPAISFTEISVQPQKKQNNGSVTRDSRTPKPLVLHTDESYAPTPCSVMGFQCLTADAQGGESIFYPLSALLGHLTAAEIKTLRQPIFPHSPPYMGPVLFGPGHDLSIQYYRPQLNIQLQQSSIDKNILSLLDKIDALLANPNDQYKLKLAAGSLLIFNNHKVLHGRTALAQETDRLLYRGRAKIDLQAAETALRPWYRRPRNLGRKFWPVLERGHANHPPLKDPQINDLSDIEKILSEQGPDIALKLVQQAIQAQPDNISLIFGLAALYRTVGDKTQAEIHLKNACDKHPFSPPFDDQEKPHSKAKKTKRDIILVRGFRHTKYHFTPDKQAQNWSARLSQGHFALGALLNPHLGIKRYLNYFDQTNWPGLHSPGLNSPGLNSSGLNSSGLNSSGLGCPDQALLINTIACADRMEQPLHGLVKLLQQSPLQPRQIINHPRYVLKTKRDDNAVNLRDIDGIYFPKTIRLKGDFKTAPEMVKNIENTGLSYPLILRPTVTHTGKYVAKVQNHTQALDYFTGHTITGDYYAIEYIETVGEDGLYNKNRLFCIDGQFYPVAGLHHDRWNIHSKDRYSVMQSSLALQQFEQDYLADLEGFVGDQAVQGLKTIYERLKLDFFGCDFTKLADGRLLIFECNASMRHNFDHAGNFPYTAPYLQAISKAFSDMAAHRLNQPSG